MSHSTKISCASENWRSSTSLAKEMALALEQTTIPAFFKSSRRLKKIHQKVLANIKDKREEIEAMAARDIRQNAKDLAETSRRSKVAVEKMTHAITIFYNKRVEHLYQRRDRAWEALGRKGGVKNHKTKQFLITLRHSAGLRAWWLNQRKDTMIQELQDAVDKLHLSFFMARLTDGGKEPNNIFAFA
ncbi:hypothetical protein FLONG3_4370 [Fusarium longipes]|uniref:Uncharacterized protein n=1 Tax=Fusarium longipes TaxID=694270 RepID=A0A395SY91_9HYPO|nr:hypothetical protein FLONG3_4370 [Fusarium longipes]